MITASLVKELREKTGAGMMDCKKVLTETDGDLEKAAELLRERGIAKAAKKSGRVAAEGMVEAFVSEDGSYDLTPCPDRNTDALKRLGMDTQNTDQSFMNIRFLPKEYLCPMDYYTGKKTITKNTYSIHHYSASWTSKTTKRTTFVKRLIGVKMYDKLYGKFLHKIKWLEW